jgi:hypothetical protein
VNSHPVLFRRCDRTLWGRGLATGGVTGEADGAELLETVVSDRRNGCSGRAGCAGCAGRHQWVDRERDCRRRVTL